MLLFRSIGNFVHSILPVSFGETRKDIGLLNQVSMPGDVKDHTQGINV